MACLVRGSNLNPPEQVESAWGSNLNPPEQGQTVRGSNLNHPEQGTFKLDYLGYSPEKFLETLETELLYVFTLFNYICLIVCLKKRSYGGQDWARCATEAETKLKNIHQ